MAQIPDFKNHRFLCRSQRTNNPNAEFSVKNETYHARLIKSKSEASLGLFSTKINVSMFLNLEKCQFGNVFDEERLSVSERWHPF